MNMPETSNYSVELRRVEALIENEVFLSLSIVDVQVYDNTLVVMTEHSVPRTFVRLLLKKVWEGPIEVYCASALLAGSGIALT